MNIQQMSKEELIEQAESMGIAINKRAKKEDIIKAITSSGGQVDSTASSSTENDASSDKENAVEQPTNSQPVEHNVAANKPSNQEKPKSEKKVKIIISGGDDGDDSRVFVSVNGRSMALPRNEEVDVSPDHLQVLKDAVKTEYKQKVHPQTGKVELVPVNKLMYPFQIVSG